MRMSDIALALALCCAAAAPVSAGQGTVTWYDSSCGYFVMSLPDEGQSEKFGLYSWRAGADPALEQIWEGDIVKGEDLEIANVASGNKMTIIHWANAKEQAQLVRNAPVQCASRWKKRR
jgi:hypothetical protein